VWAAAVALLALSAAAPVGAVAIGGVFGGPSRAGGSSSYWNLAAVGEQPDRWAAMAELVAFRFGARFERAGTDPNTGQPFEPMEFSTLAPNPTFTLAAPTPWPSLQVVAGGFTPLSQGVFWPDDGPHAYHATDSRMVAYGVAAGLAWHITDRVTVAVAGGPVYGNLHLGYAMDFGAYANGLLPPGSQAMPLEDPQLKGWIDANATGWGVMAVGGVWAQPWDWLRLGLGVVVPSPVHVEGDLRLDSSPALDEALPGFQIASTGDLAVDFPLYNEVHLEAELSLDEWTVGLLGFVYPTPEVRIIRGMVSGSEAEFLNGEQLSLNDPRHDWLLGARVSRRLGERWEAGLRFDWDPRCIPNEVVHPGNMDFTSLQLGAGARWYMGEQRWLELSWTQLIIFANTVSNSAWSPYAPPESGLGMPSANGVYSAKGFLVTLGAVGLWGG